MDWSGVEWICKTWTGFVKGGFVKHGFVKGGFVKHGFVKGGFVKDGFVKGGFVKDGFVKRWIFFLCVFFLLATQSRSKLRAIRIAWKRLIGSPWVPLFINQSECSVLVPFLH